MAIYLYFFPVDAAASIHVGGEKKSMRVYMSRKSKVAIVIMTVLPKVAIVVLLTLFGCGIVLESSDSGALELLQNALAVAFVMEIDEILCRNLVQTYLKDIIDALPRVCWQEKASEKVLRNFFLNLIFCGAYSIFIWVLYCFWLFSD
ncbi:hypothetical protein MHBO_002007 [Bonamia ostreae]|uniref:Uncharacterized protein n=1 Tax=Bonamia ostreae TaxID=126728 RepID=A0ABV2AKW4_9EUKA